MSIKQKIERKKAAVELTKIAFDEIKPILDAGTADRNARDEKKIYEYFKACQDDPDTHVKEVSISQDVFGTKVFVQFQDKDYNFTTKKFNYDKLMQEIKEKEETNTLCYGKVLDHCSELLERLTKNMINLLDLDYEKILAFGDTLEEIKDINDKICRIHQNNEYFKIDIEELERMDSRLITLAKKMGIELESGDALTEASIRELLDKEALSYKEKKFIIDAAHYLKDETTKNESLKEHNKFSKLSENEKYKISYYELLFQKIFEYQFNLNKKAMTGEMMNKLIVESSQKSKREEEQMIEKVLGDEPLEDKDYRKLAVLNFDYNKMSIYTLLKSYTLDDINRKLEVYEKLIERDSKHSVIYFEQEEILDNWKSLIENLKSENAILNPELEDFARNLFNIHIRDMRLFIESQENGEQDDYKRKFSNQYEFMLKKILEYINSKDGLLKMLSMSFKEDVESYLRTIKNDNYLLNISETLNRVGENFPKNVYDYQSVIEACYDYYSERAIPSKHSEYTDKLREIVGLQVAEVESGMSPEVLNMIREDKLVLPKENVKKKRM